MRQTKTTRVETRKPGGIPAALMPCTRRLRCFATTISDAPDTSGVQALDDAAQRGAPLNRAAR